MVTRGVTRKGREQEGDHSPPTLSPIQRSEVTSPVRDKHRKQAVWLSPSPNVIRHKHTTRTHSSLKKSDDAYEGYKMYGWEYMVKNYPALTPLQRPTKAVSTNDWRV